MELSYLILAVEQGRKECVDEYLRKTGYNVNEFDRNGMGNAFMKAAFWWEMSKWRCTSSAKART